MKNVIGKYTLATVMTFVAPLAYAGGNDVGNADDNNLLNRVSPGQYQAQCDKYNSESPVEFAAANITKNDSELTVELLGTLYGSVPSTLVMEFSKVASKKVSTSKVSVNDNIVVPGTVEEITVIKNSNESVAGIQEVSKTKLGAVTLSSSTSTIILSLQNGRPMLSIESDDGGKITCILSK
ncbi:MAG: hypothetical protein J7501_16015 [Bdellovibrio sp.]|nr:hypothetical protein [Bdellovibrio sp.]